MAEERREAGSGNERPDGERVRALAAAVRRRRAELGLRQAEVADLAKAPSASSTPWSTASPA